MKWLISGLFLVMLVAAICFRYERVLFCDASYILFRIVNLDSLQIQEHRYGSFVTQMFPLFGARLGLSLAAIVTLYSASFPMFYLAVAALLVFRFRAYGLALLMSFYFLLYVSDSWFWTNNEVHQGIAWMFLFLAVFKMMQDRFVTYWMRVPVFLILSFLAVYSHLLVFFPILFLWIFFLLEKEIRMSKKEMLLYSTLLFGLILSKFLLSTSSQSYYDVDKLHATTHLSFARIGEAIVSPTAKEILKRSLWNYWLVPVLFFTGIHSAYRAKKIWPILLTTAFSLLYFLAVCLTFPNFLAFYTETEWMALSIIATTPFVYYTLPSLQRKKAFALIAVIYLVRLTYIGFSSPKFIERKEWILTNLQQMESKKITKGIIYENEEISKTLLMHWGVPTESLIASAISGSEPQASFVVGTPENIRQRLPGDKQSIIGPFETWNTVQLNKRYFRIDTTTMYRELTSADK